MVNRVNSRFSINLSSLLKGVSSLTFLFLLIEFFDELNYGVDNAALPAIRTGLGLSYVQVGLLLGLPGIINTLIEPVLMLFGDTRYRKHIMLAGGMAIVLSLLLIASATSFATLLLAVIIAYPASGAFVSLSQATMMDHNPGRESHMIARWTVSGSAANLIGPLILAAGFALGFGWRWAFYGLALLCAVLVVVMWRKPIPMAHRVIEHGDGGNLFKGMLSGVGEAIRNPRILRWMVLLQFSDMLLDILTGYLALYFTDVMGISVAQASLMLGILAMVGLVSNIMLIPLLEKIPGRRLVRISATAAGVLYAAWLLAPWLWAKIGLIILVKLVSMGWYEVLDGETFAALPGRSGTLMAIGSVFNLMGGAISFFIGWVAAQAGLPAAMWVMLLGPVMLVLFIPRGKAA